MRPVAEIQTKEDLFAIIAAKDAEIGSLLSQLAELKAAWAQAAIDRGKSFERVVKERDEASALQLRAIHERDVTNRLLGELLAVIHCDGGHYQAEHGAAKAVQDGIKAVSELREKLAASEASDGESIAMYRKVRDERDEAREEAAANAACARRLYGICEHTQKFVATFAGALPVTRRSNYARNLLAQIDGALAATPEHLW